MAHNVFISHAQTERATADAMCKALEASGWRCWIWYRDQEPGQRFRSSIVKAIKECRVFVVIMAAGATRSPMVSREVEIAWEEKKPIIPFRIENGPMSDTFRFCIDARHWLDAFPPPLEPHFARLTVSVQRLLSPTTETASAAPPAPVSVAPTATPSAGHEAGGKAAHDLAAQVGRLIGGITRLVGADERPLSTLRPPPPGKGPSVKDQASRAYEAGRYVEALRLFQTAADQGDSDAQFSVAYMYSQGEGIPTNLAEAAKWYLAAAQQGRPRAQLNVGFMYEAGQGVNQDEVIAAQWYQAAAQQGHPKGQLNLALLYLNGRGIKKNGEKAAQWFRASAMQGNADAQFYLGRLHNTGSGVPHSFEDARRWFEKAAAQGHVLAQAELGALYENGHGVAKDYAAATKWYRMAAQQGNDWAVSALKRLKR